MLLECIVLGADNATTSTTTLCYAKTTVRVRYCLAAGLRIVCSLITDLIQLSELDSLRCTIGFLSKALHMQVVFKPQGRSLLDLIVDSPTILRSLLLLLAAPWYGKHLISVLLWVD